MKQMAKYLSVALAFGLTVSACAPRSSVKEKETMTIKKPEGMAGPKRRVGVVDFANKTKYGEARLGSSASDILITELSKSGKFILVERDKMNTLLGEQKLGMSGAIDSTTAARVGRILGLNAIVTGAISEFGSTTEGSEYLLAQSKRQVVKATVDIRVVDAETGQILYADSGSGLGVKKSGGVLGLGTRQGYLNAGNDSNLPVGKTLSLYKIGREIKDPTTGLSIGNTEEKTGEIKVVRYFGDDGSVAELVKGSMPTKGDIARLKE
jgi:curli biogenesis system outer membrane secretion channel CsgG